MHQYYDSFRKLCDELAVKNRIDPILAELYSKRTELESACVKLKQIMVQEQADVERLKETNVTSIFYTVIGQKDKKLEKEKAEAFDAEEKFNSIQKELADLDEEIKKYERELRAVRGCDLRYGRLLPQIIDEIKAIDSPAAKTVLDTFNTLTSVEVKLSALDEALALSRDALKNTKETGATIEQAHISAQGLKYSSNHPLYTNLDIKAYLSNAQPIVDELCRQIARLDASLVASHIDFEIKIEVGNYPDDIADWKDEIDRLIPQIEKVQEKLISARDRWAKRVSELRIELQEQIKTVLE